MGPVARAHRLEAERAGFEPAMDLSAHTRFPVALLRPLGHLSGRASVPSRGFPRLEPLRGGGGLMRRKLVVFLTALFAMLTVSAPAQGTHTKTLTVGQQSQSCPTPGSLRILDAIEDAAPGDTI